MLFRRNGSFATKNDDNGAKTKMWTLNYHNWWETTTLTNSKIITYPYTNLRIDRWEVANHQQYAVAH